MFKQASLVIFLTLSFCSLAKIEIPDAIQDQIIEEVMSDSGYYDAAEVEERKRLWVLAQPQPNASEDITESGSCIGSCLQSGGNQSLPKPRNVEFKGKVKEGKLTQNLIIKWKRPQALTNENDFQLEKYKVILSKNGQTFEKFKVKTKYKNNGKPKKHQKLKLRNLGVGDYAVQVKAVYKQNQNTSFAKSASIKTSNSLSSEWTEKEQKPVKPDPSIVADIDANSALYACLTGNPENTPNEDVGNYTLLTDITRLNCIEQGLIDSDIQLLSLFDGLVFLDIKKNSAITNISPLGDISQLSWLNLNWNHLIDLSPLADESKFNSLESLYLSWMGLTKIPEFPETITYISLVGNLISDNNAGFIPDFPLEVIDVSNNKQTLDVNNEPTGGLVLNDQFISNLVNNNFAVKTFKARHTVLTNLSLMAGIDGLENLEIWNANLNATQDLGDFSGFCSLSIHSEQLVKLKEKRPVRFLDLSANPDLKNAELLRTTFTDQQYRPIQTNLTGSNAMKCVGYYEIIDSTESYLFDMNSVQPFNLTNGEAAQIPACPVIRGVQSNLSHAEFCKPNAVQNSFAAYEDIDSSRRFITWEVNESHDYERWGVTHFKISTYQGPQLLNVHFQPSDEPYVFIDTDIQPDKYVIQACTEHVCGYERTYAGGFKQGLTQVTDITQHWSTDNEQVSFKFSYPAGVFNTTDGKGAPDFFRIAPTFTQPLGSATIPHLDVSVVNDQHQYETNWQSDNINIDQYIGTGYLIQACRNDLGCGVPATVQTRKPDPVLTINALQGVQAQALQNDPLITLSWNYESIDTEVVDYIEIIETQPQMKASYKAVPGLNPTSNISEKEVIYYTDGLDKILNLSRAINGVYGFSLRACHRDRVDGDSCSAPVTVEETIARVNSIPNEVDLQYYSGPHYQEPFGRKTFNTLNSDGSYNHYWSGYVTHGSNSYINVWKASEIKFDYGTVPNQTTAADYFYFEKLSGSTQCVAKIKNPDDSGPIYIFKEMNHFTVQNDVRNKSGIGLSTRKTCLFPKPYGEWAISACFNGIGCGEAKVLNLGTNEITTLDINNTEVTQLSLSQDSENVEISEIEDGLSRSSGGAGDLPPGHYWDPRQSGTGWQFHWATHLDGSESSPNIIRDHRVTYDLVAYWFAYSKLPRASSQVPYDWTPAWYKAKLVRQSDGELYKGSLVYYEKKNGVLDEKVVGTIVININDVDSERNSMDLNIDFDGTDATMLLDDNTHDVPCRRVADNQGNLNIDQCTLYLENSNILLVDGGTSGTTSVGRFGFGNDSDHYSGVWADGWNESLGQAENTLITTIHRGLEVSWVATFDTEDDDGNSKPIWAVGQSCDGDNCFIPSDAYFNRYKSDDTSLNIYTPKKGFDPLKFTPSEFWGSSSGSPISLTGKLGRCFDQKDFNSGHYFLDIDISPDKVQERHADFTVGSESGMYNAPACDNTNTSNLQPLKKIAGNHFIGFEINPENDFSSASELTCNPAQQNGLGTCSINFNWYTNGSFEVIEPFYSRDGGVYQRFVQSDLDLCREPVGSNSIGGQVVKDFNCYIDNNSTAPITYDFQLRKKKYEPNNNGDSDPNNWVAIAQSQPLKILACSPSGCENNIILEQPFIEAIDPVVTNSSNMEALMDHYPGDGPVQGSAGVSGGAATYNIPLLVPPGVNGMTPNLSINYSSKGGNGVMGVGWSHGEGSSIYRCAATIAQDNYSKAVTFDNSPASGDRLCLDGQKLKVVLNNYWANGSEYRTEQESFNKVVYDSSNNRFTVYTKSGRIRAYSLHGEINWLIDNETDSFGNSMDYSYTTAGTNEILLSKITYRGNLNADEENRYIDFEYQPRVDDYSVSYLHGRKTEQTKRLKSISTSVGASIVRTYEMDYKNSLSSSNTLLKSINEISETISRVLFDAQWSDEGWDSNPASQVSYKNIRADVLGNFTSGNRPRNITNLKPSLDFNGDGIKDLSYGPENLNQFQNAGIVFLDENSRVLNVLDGFGAKDVNRVGPGDINADGINDLIAYDELTGSLRFYEWQVGKDIESGNSQFSSYFSVQNMDLDFSQVMINQFDWGVPNRTCGSNNYLLNFDPQAAEFYIRDYDNDGLDDVLVLVQLKEGRYQGSGDSDCRWSIETYQIKSKLLLFKNISTWPRIAGKVKFNPVFDDIKEVMDLEPKFERERETGGINFYLYDNIKSIEDFNGDGLLDFEIKRLSKWKWDVSDIPMVPTLVNHRLFFQTFNSQKPVPRTLEQLGLKDFKCLKVGETEVDLCDQANTEATGFGPNSLSFEDINGDGLKDVLYYDHAIMSFDSDGKRVYDRDIQRNWKVRLNRGGSYDSEIFESTSIESPLVTSGSVVNNFLPQGDICSNINSINDLDTRKKMYKICNFVFRTGVRYADINADGSRELIFPNADNLVLNRCMITGGVVTRGSGEFNTTDFCTTNQDIFEDPTNLGLNGPGKQELCQDMANLNVLESMESSVVNPSLDSHIPEFILSNEEHFFGSQGSSCLNGSCTQEPSNPNPPNFPQDPQFIPETLQGNGNNLAYACSSPIGPFDNYKYGLYSDLGGLNALWDRGVYGFSALDFELTSDGMLEIAEIDDSGIYSTLFWGGDDDHSGDGVSDYYAPVGCMFEPQGYDLIGCTNDNGVDTASEWAADYPFKDVIVNAGDDGYDSGGHHILMTRDQNEMPDMLKRIDVPKSGQWYNWSYSPLSDKSRTDFPVYSLPERIVCTVDSNQLPGQSICADGYIENEGAQGEYFYFNSSMYVVSEMQMNSGIGDIESSNLYAYEEAVYNNQGRGFQGFRKITVLNYPDIDSDENITESISEFNQIFPLSGKLDTVQVNLNYGTALDDRASHTRYNWYETNESNHSAKGVYFNPIERHRTITYKDGGEVVQSIQDISYDDCTEANKAYDSYGNNLCNESSVTSYLDLNSRTSGKNQEKLITKTETITTNAYFSAEIGQPDDDPWWVDKLKSTQVTTTINETGAYAKPSDYVASSLSTSLLNKFYWKSGQVRQLDCQFTLGDNSSAVNSCASDISGSNSLKNSFTYDSYGHVDSISSEGEPYIGSTQSQIEAAARNTTTSYTESSGYFANQIDNEDLVSEFTYDARTGQVIEQTDPNGLITRNTYDAFGYMTEQSIVNQAAGADLALQSPATMAMQSCFRSELIENEDGDEEEVTVCLSENLLVDDLMSAMSSKINTLAPDYKGHLFNNGYNTPILTYKTQTRQPGAPVVTQWYDQNSQLVLTKTQYSLTSETAQDTYSLSLTNHLGQTEIVTEPFQVDANWSLTDSRLYPYFTLNVFDGKGQQIQKHSEVGQLTDSTGTCWRETVYAYDGLSTQVTASFDGDGCDVTDIDELVMSRSYDASGRLRQTVDADDKIVDYWYDGAGNPYMIQDAGSNIIETDFDNLGRKLSVKDPNMGLKTFQYNAYGEVVYSQDAKQAATDIGNYFKYDQLGRLVEQYSNTASNLQPVNGKISYKDIFDYLPDKTVLGGNYRSSNESDENEFNAAQATSYSYDDFARITNQNYVNNSDYDGYGTIEFNIDYYYYRNYNYLKQTIYTLPNRGITGYSVVNEYDVFGALTRQRQNPVVEDIANADNELMRISGWNLRGQPVERVLNNIDDMSTVYGYYPGTGQVKQIINGNNTLSDQQFDYSYDAWGNIASQTLTNGANPLGLSENFGYDQLQRLTDSKVSGLTQIDYVYDQLGNLTIKSDYATAQGYGVGTAGPNAITSSTLLNGQSKSYHYDLAGNRIEDKVNGLAQNTYEYDANNLMTKSQKTTGDQYAKFRYGADNQRYIREEESLNPQGERTIEATFYAGSAFEFIRNDADDENLTKFHVTDYLTVTRRPNRLPEKAFLQKDRLGSTTQILDENGAVIATKGYDAFGKPRDGDDWSAMMDGIEPVPALNFEENSNDSTLTDITKRGFTGHEHLDNFELIHMNGRMYDFNSGRFLSVDPFIQGSDSQAINPYSYIQNNPLSGTDPTGYYITRENCDIVSSNCSKANVTVKHMVDGLSGETNNGHANRFTMQGAGANKVGNSMTMADVESQVMNRLADEYMAGFNNAFNLPGYGGSLAMNDNNLYSEIQLMNAFGYNEMSEEEYRAYVDTAAKPTEFAASMWAGGKVLQGGIKSIQWLSRVFKIGNGISGRLVRSSDEVLELAIKQGSERISGFAVDGTRQLVGNTLQRDVLRIATEAGKGKGSIRSLLNTFESGARNSGANSIRIVGHEVQNATFFRNAKLVEKLGYQFNKIDNKTFEIFKVLD